MRAIAMNEEQGGFQQLTGFSRFKGNRNLGGSLEWESKWDKLLGNFSWNDIGQSGGGIRSLGGTIQDNIILGWISQGLNLTKNQKNPFSFDKEGVNRQLKVD